MARQPKEADHLTDAEKCDLIEREVPTNADEYMRLRDVLGPLAAVLNLPYRLRRYYE